VLLAEMDEKTLDYVLTRSPEERQRYFSGLIINHFPKISQETEQFLQLLVGYECSFMLEKLYRNNLHLREGFTPIYTQTGLIREIVNDIYMHDDKLKVH